MEKQELPPELKESECNGLKLFDNKEKLKTWRNNLRGIEYEESDILLHEQLIIF